MRRRQVLRVGAGSLPVALAGCLSSGAPGDGGGRSPTPSPSPSPGPPGTPVSVVASADQPDAPVEYGVEMAEPLATDEHPARVRASIRNPTDSKVVLGEERAVQFHHVASEDDALYLMPVGDGPGSAPVEPGCWRLTEAVAVATYYGTVSIAAGETVSAESYVYGHPALPDGVCLPAGDHRVRTSGRAARDADGVLSDSGDSRTFEWGFTLRVGR